MAPPALVMPIEFEVTAYPSFTRIFHHPSPTAFSGGAVTPLSSTADDIALIFVILIASLGALSVVWLCCRARTRAHSPREPAEVEAGATKEVWTYGCTKTPETTHPVWATPPILSPGLIGAAQTRMNGTFLSEVPHVWRALGRSKATVDSEKIPEHREAAS
ncbi:hypothetical protein C8R44DRAFT_874634 [Mycena epipterygia]|nr:hypothetical protein C8R44DRAFT_874634 [Mycena epipterygia]